MDLRNRGREQPQHVASSNFCFSFLLLEPAHQQLTHRNTKTVVYVNTVCWKREPRNPNDCLHSQWFLNRNWTVLWLGAAAKPCEDAALQITSLVCHLLQDHGDMCKPESFRWQPSRHPAGLFVNIRSWVSFSEVTGLLWRIILLPLGTASIFHNGSDKPFLPRTFVLASFPCYTRCFSGPFQWGWEKRLDYPSRSLTPGIVVCLCVVVVVIASIAM